MGEMALSVATCFFIPCFWEFWGGSLGMPGVWSGCGWVVYLALPPEGSWVGRGMPKQSCPPSLGPKVEEAIALRIPLAGGLL